MPVKIPETHILLSNIDKVPWPSRSKKYPKKKEEKEPEKISALESVLDKKALVDVTNEYNPATKPTGNQAWPTSYTGKETEGGLYIGRDKKQGSLPVNPGQSTDDMRAAQGSEMAKDAIEKSANWFTNMYHKYMPRPGEDEPVQTDADNRVPNFLNPTAGKSIYENEWKTKAGDIIRYNDKEGVAWSGPAGNKGFPENTNRPSDAEFQAFAGKVRSGSQNWLANSPGAKALSEVPPLNQLSGQARTDKFNWLQNQAQNKTHDIQNRTLEPYYNMNYNSLFSGKTPTWKDTKWLDKYHDKSTHNVSSITGKPVDDAFNYSMEKVRTNKVPADSSTITPDKQNLTPPMNKVSCIQFKDVLAMNKMAYIDAPEYSRAGATHQVPDQIQLPFSKKIVNMGDESVSNTPVNAEQEWQNKNQRSEGGQANFDQEEKIQENPAGIDKVNGEKILSDGHYEYNVDPLHFLGRYVKRPEYQEHVVPYLQGYLKHFPKGHGIEFSSGKDKYIPLNPKTLNQVAKLIISDRAISRAPIYYKKASMEKEATIPLPKSEFPTFRDAAAHLLQYLRHKTIMGKPVGKVSAKYIDDNPDVAAVFGLSHVIPIPGVPAAATAAYAGGKIGTKKLLKLMAKQIHDAPSELPKAASIDAANPSDSGFSTVQSDSIHRNTFVEEDRTHQSESEEQAEAKRHPYDKKPISFAEVKAMDKAAGLQGTTSFLKKIPQLYNEYVDPVDNLKNLAEKWGKVPEKFTSEGTNLFDTGKNVLDAPKTVLDTTKTFNEWTGNPSKAVQKPVANVFQKATAPINKAIEGSRVGAWGKALGPGLFAGSQVLDMGRTAFWDPEKEELSIADVPGNIRRNAEAKIKEVEENPLAKAPTAGLYNPYGTLAATGKVLSDTGEALTNAVNPKGVAYSAKGMTPQQNWQRDEARKEEYAKKTGQPTQRQINSMSGNVTAGIYGQGSFNPSNKGEWQPTDIIPKDQQPQFETSVGAQPTELEKATFATNMKKSPNWRASHGFTKAPTLETPPIIKGENIAKAPSPHERNVFEAAQKETPEYKAAHPSGGSSLPWERPAMEQVALK